MGNGQNKLRKLFDLFYTISIIGPNHIKVDIVKKKWKVKSVEQLEKNGVLTEDGMHIYDKSTTELCFFNKESMSHLCGKVFEHDFENSDEYIIDDSFLKKWMCDEVIKNKEGYQHPAGYVFGPRNYKEAKCYLFEDIELEFSGEDDEGPHFHKGSLLSMSSCTYRKFSNDSRWFMYCRVPIDPPEKKMRLMTQSELWGKTLVKEDGNAFIYGSVSHESATSDLVIKIYADEGYKINPDDIPEYNDKCLPLEVEEK